MKINFLEGCRKHINENYILYIVSFMFVLIGVVMGMYVVRYMGDTYKNDLSNYLLSFVNEIGGTEINNKYMLFQGIKNNVLILGAIYILGFTIVGIPFIFVIDLIKGFTLGFSSAVIINSLGTKGMIFSLLTLVPQNLIYVPCIMFASVFSINVAWGKIKGKLNKSYPDAKVNSSFCTYVMLASILVITLGAIVEGYFSPFLLRIIYK